MRLVHKLYFLKVKEVLALFDKIFIFRLLGDSDPTTQHSILDCVCLLYVGTIKVEYTA